MQSPDAAPRRRSVVVFDVGGVLLQWDPRHLYRKLFAGDDAAMEHFLGNVCTEEWNERQDAGRTFADAAAELLPAHADKAHLIHAFGRRFDEMIPGAIEETVDILRELKRAGVPLYAVTNWSAETFPSAQNRFDFLAEFDGIVVSGEEGVIKPDPRIFRILLDRYDIPAHAAVFIDDNPANAEAATNLGIHGIHFRSPQRLRRELVELGLL
jgi:2-haloacid dehalogenase